MGYSATLAGHSRAVFLLVLGGTLILDRPHCPGASPSTQRVWQEIESDTVLFEVLRHPGTPNATVRELGLAVQKRHSQMLRGTTRWISALAQGSLPAAVR